MSQKFRVSFNSPQSGFMSVGLRAGEQKFVAAVAHVPYDSLRDLLVALNAALTSDGEQIVKWNCEPDELDFNLTADAERVRLDVVHYLSHRRSRRTSQPVFTVSGSKFDICGAFWKALRELHRDIETDDFASNWRREFPETEMRELTKTIRAYKREMKPGTRPGVR